MKRFWKQVLDNYPIILGLLTIGILWGSQTTTVSAHGEEIGTLKAEQKQLSIEFSAKQEQMNDAINKQAVTNARIEQKVDDIRATLRHRDR